jgi:hypothetical protein
MVTLQIQLELQNISGRRWNTVDEEMKFIPGLHSETDNSDRNINAILFKLFFKDVGVGLRFGVQNWFIVYLCIDIPYIKKQQYLKLSHWESTLAGNHPNPELATRILL